MGRKRQTVKSAMKSPDKGGKGTSSSKWPWIVLLFAVLLSTIPMGFYLWNYRSGTFNAWWAQQKRPSTFEANPQMESDFSKAFGIDPSMSAEFDDKLTDGGAASPEEMNRRVAVFSKYVQEHVSSFNSDPHAAIRKALDDPAAFGLKAFKKRPRRR